MTTQLVAKPQGVLTEPNKVGQYPPGAFALLTNGAIRSFGCLEQVEQWSASSSLGGTPIGGAYVVASRKLTVFLTEMDSTDNWVLSYFWLNESSGALSTGNITLTGNLPFYMTSDQRTGMLIMRNRLIITTPVEAFAIDFIEDTTGALSAVEGPRPCGPYQPAINDRSVATTAEADGGVLGPNKHMSATAVHRVVFPDGYEIMSVPAMLWDFANLSSTLTQIPSAWEVVSNVLYSSINQKQKLDVYRTREQSVGYDSINNKYLPVATGSSFYLSKTADRTSSFTTLTDSTLASALGESLLTNVAVGGAAALPRAPTSAKTCAEFRGHAFYANRIEPPSITILNPYFWGVIPQTAPATIATYGIGFRRYTAAAATNGSATVTGLANTTGVTAEQNIVVTRTDTGATVLQGLVVSKTASTVTANVSSSYTGSVTVTIEDVIKVNGTPIGVGASASAFALNLITNGFYNRLDVTAVALEPQMAITGAGVYPGYAPTGGLMIRDRLNGFTFSLRATNGNNYSPRLPEITATALVIESKPQPNGFAWSENNEPENCPAANYAFAGAGEIYKIIATRDCLWFFCSDGLFRLSGNGGSVGDGYDWVIDPVDPRLVIHNPNCAVVHREYVYAYTNRGFISISSEGVVRELSDGRLNPSAADTTKLPNRTWTYVDNNAVNDSIVWMAVDSANDEVWLRTGSWESNPKQIWVYNTKTDTFCVRIPTLYSPREVPTLGIYNQGQQLVYTLFAGRSQMHRPNNNVGNSVRNYEELAVTIQPIYGNSKNSAHTVKHWQDIQFSFKTPQPVSSCLITLRGVGDQQVRTIPQVTGRPNSENSRVGFAIWRNFPAMSNACSFTMFLGATTAVSSPVTLEAFSVNFIDFTDQRATR